MVFIKEISFWQVSSDAYWVFIEIATSIISEF